MDFGVAPVRTSSDPRWTEIEKAHAKREIQNTVQAVGEVLESRLREVFNQHLTASIIRPLQEVAERGVPLHLVLEETMRAHRFGPNRCPPVPFKVVAASRFKNNGLEPPAAPGFYLVDLRGPTLLMGPFGERTAAVGKLREITTLARWQCWVAHALGLELPEEWPVSL